jgi:hypothetical protein
MPTVRGSSMTDVTAAVTLLVDSRAGRVVWSAERHRELGGGLRTHSTDVAGDGGGGEGFESHQLQSRSGGACAGSGVR